MFKRLFAVLLLSSFTLQSNFVMSELSSTLNNQENCVTSCHHPKGDGWHNSSNHHTLKTRHLIVKENVVVGGNITATGVVRASSFITPTGPLSIINRGYGKLSASLTIGSLIITSPQASQPPVTGWQPFPVDTFSTSLNVTSATPTDATFTVQHAGTYRVTANLTLQYPDPSSGGPDDLTNYSIAVAIDDVIQNDSYGSLHISTEGGHENPGLLFSASLDSLYTLSANSTVQFLISGSDGSPAYMNVVSAVATIAQVGN